MAPQARRARLSIPAGVQYASGWRDVPTFEGPPALDGIRRALTGAGGAPLRLVDGDVLARSDFPRLLDALDGQDALVETHGAALRAPAVLKALASARSLGVSVTLFSADAACHDWVAGAKEASLILRGARAALNAGLSVEVDVPLVRPGLQGLGGTVATLVALGVRHLRIRALRLQHTPVDRRVALGARVGLLERPLAEAGAVALRSGVDLTLTGLPSDVVPQNLRRYVTPDAPTDLAPVYVDTFGALERRLSPSGSVELLEVGWTPDEPSREARRRLLRALEHRPERLRLVGRDVLRHPAAPELLREAVRAAPRVELDADLTPMETWTDDERHRVRKVVRGAST